MTIIQLTKDNFEAQVLKSEKPVLVDFWAPWCGPCRMAGPIMEELAQEYQDKAVIGKVNIDEEDLLAQKYGVMSIPTVVVFKNGKEAERVVGFPGKAGYEKLIRKYIK